MTSILVVDDHPAVTNMIEQTCAMDGYECYAANSYGEAMQCIDRKYDLVIADIFLDDNKSGRQILSEYLLKHPGGKVLEMTCHQEFLRDNPKCYDKTNGIETLRKIIRDIVMNGTSGGVLVIRLEEKVEEHERYITDLKLSSARHDEQISGLRCDMSEVKLGIKEVIDKVSKSDEYQKTLPLKLIGAIGVIMSIGFALIKFL